MRLSNPTTVVTYHASFNTDETKQLLKHEEFSKWIGLDWNSGEVKYQKKRPRSSAQLTIKKLERIATYLDIDYRLVKDTAERLRDGFSDEPAIIAGMIKPDAESKVDRLRIARIRQ